MSSALGILGADGRMGAAVINAIADRDDVHLGAAITAPNAAALGQDAGTVAGLNPMGVALTANMKTALENCDVLIDFSAPKAAIQVTALSVLVELAAEKLGTGWDIEVLEMHHRHKVDAPSGTALLLGEAAAKGRGVELPEKQVLSRIGVTGERNADDIGFAVLRGGGVIGRHDVLLANEREMITLSHDAFDRSVFARGAVSAAVWTAAQKSGRYTMRDVLGF